MTGKRGKPDIRRRTSIEPKTVQEAKAGPAVLLDSSCILALLDARDPHNLPTTSVLGFLKPHNCRFLFPSIVFIEVMSRLIQKGGHVSSALKTLEDFLTTLQGIHWMSGATTPEIIVRRYKALAKKKIRFLQSNDFIIATEGIGSSAIILTCDVKMYEQVRKYYPKIFLIATKSKKYRGDITRLVKELEVSVW